MVSNPLSLLFMMDMEGLAAAIFSEITYINTSLITRVSHKILKKLLSKEFIKLKLNLLSLLKRNSSKPTN